MKKVSVLSVVVLLLLIGCVSQSTYDLKAKEALTLSSQSEDLQAQVKTLTSDVEVLKMDRGALVKQKDAIQKERDELQVKNNELSLKAEKAEQLEKATQTYQDLQKKLEKEIREGQVKITEMKNRLTMTMVDKIIFPSGSTEISKEGKAVMDKVISILKDVKDKRIQVEGHTDNVKIVSELRKRFPTNWELSTARATEVARYLQETGGINPILLSATGYGEYQPVAPNDTDEGKSANRRIEIVLLPPLK
ncbi:MAG: OmpA family protein [Nitrospirae bacterium]|nr:OmpA family protein [Nitrospirota bacterium]